MKNLVNFLFVFALFAVSGCNSYEQDQEVFDQVTELAASEEAALGIDEKTNSGGNAGTDPR